MRATAATGVRLFRVVDLATCSQLAQESLHFLVGSDPHERHPIGLECEDDTQAQSHPCLPDAATVQLANPETLVKMRLPEGSWQSELGGQASQWALRPLAWTGRIVPTSRSGLLSKRVVKPGCGALGPPRVTH